ncbi:MAG: response regulator [Calditrichaceae bacterium]|jgi:DNA-binding response OmpR family regulator
MIEIDAQERTRILILEDDEDHAFLEEDILSDELHCEIRVVESKAKLTEDDIYFADVVLLDFTLPDASGDEILSYIREKTDVPVIIITGDEHVKTAVNTLKGGASDFVIKSPQNIAILPRIVNRVLEEYKNMKILEKEKREKEELNTKIETLHQVLTTLAHYINNSTSTISGYAQLCEQGGVKESRFERLVNICSSETRKITLVLKELEQYVNSMEIKTTNYVNIPNAMFAIEDAIKKKMQEPDS